MTESKFSVHHLGGAPIKLWDSAAPFEAQAMEQLRKTSMLPFIHSHVAGMPDVHLGIGATVGSVVPTKGAIIPAAVGVDIGCVDCDTEYLSPSGWQKISEYVEGDVLCYNPETKTAYFVHPYKHVVRESKGFYRLKTKYGVNQKISSDHKMLVYVGGRQDLYEKYRTPTAEEFSTKHKSLVAGCTHRIKTAPEFCSLFSRVDLTLEQIRVVVMTSADCLLTPRRAILRVKKKRKFERAKQLLSSAGVEILKEEFRDDIFQIDFSPVSEVKSLTQFYGASREQLSVIIDEILHWDGNLKDKVFFTAVEKEADFVHWALTICGFRGVLRKDARQTEVGGKIRKWIDYRVYRNENTLVGVNGYPKTPIEFVESTDGKEYCFGVETGFFIIRRGGVTAITGNCGMVAQRTSLTANDMPSDLKPLYAEIARAVPHGRTNNGGEGDRGSWSRSGTPASVANTWRTKLEPRFKKILAKYPRIGDHNAATHLGSLGGGNHFVEVCLDEEDQVWAMLHSGSRGVGNRIGQQFIRAAKEDVEKSHQQSRLPDPDLAFLTENTQLFDDYVEAMLWAQDYAMLNRQLMMDRMLEAMRKVLPVSFTLDKVAINSHHNYASREHHFGEDIWVTRKGAVNAARGQLGIIPGSMGTGSFIVEGLGNAESFCSCSHGAGRRLSRGKAKAEITMEQHAEAMQGIEARLDKDVLDESPAAYKPIESVMAAQTDLVRPVHRLRQILNIKG